MIVNSPPILDWTKFQSSRLSITTGLLLRCVIAIGIWSSTTRSIAAEKSLEISVKVVISMAQKVARFEVVVKREPVKSSLYSAWFVFTRMPLTPLSFPRKRESIT